MPKNDIEMTSFSSWNLLVALVDHLPHELHHAPETVWNLANACVKQKTDNDNCRNIQVGAIRIFINTTFNVKIKDLPF